MLRLLDPVLQLEHLPTIGLATSAQQAGATNAREEIQIPSLGSYETKKSSTFRNPDSNLLQRFLRVFFRGLEFAIRGKVSVTTVANLKAVVGSK